MPTNHSSPRPDQDVEPLLNNLRSFAKDGEFNNIGKLVTSLDIRAGRNILSLGEFFRTANAAQSDTNTTHEQYLVKAASIIIEALVQRQESVPLLHLGCLSWCGHARSPTSMGCLAAALHLGPLDELYETIQAMKATFSPPGLRRNLREYYATTIIQLAQLGYVGAFFCAAELLRDGDGCVANLPVARMYFYRFALHTTSLASIDLKLAGEAFAEVVKLTDIHRGKVRSFCSTMSVEATRASRNLSANVPGDEFETILGLPETTELEFKSTLRWDIRAEKENPALVHEVVKTISAFLNTRGGVLVIGIGPDKHLVGLELDYKTLKDPNEDGFRRLLGEIITRELGVPVSSQLVDFDVIPYRGVEVCRVEVRPSQKPVYVKRKDTRCLYVRIGNYTQPLTEPSAIEDWLNQRTRLS